MADTLSRLIGPANIASGTNTVFTGIAGHTYSIRLIEIVNNSVNNVAIKLGIGGVADANLILASSTIDAGGMAIFNGVLSLSGAETIQANTNFSGMTITISGLDQS